MRVPEAGSGRRKPGPTTRGSFRWCIKFSSERIEVQRGKPTNRLLDSYIGIPILNLLTLLRRRRPYPNQINNVGIFVNPALGDTLLASAAVRDIRRIFPSTTLIFFSGRSNLAAAKLLPDIDLLEEIPITRPWQAIRILRKSKLDLLLDFTSWQRLTALLSYFSRAKYTIGFRRRGQFRHRGYDLAVSHLGSCHEIENMRRMTEVLGVTEHCAPQLRGLPDSQSSMLPDLKSMVVFHPWASGALRTFREWPEDRWVELARRLHTRERTFLLTGGPGDIDRCRDLQQRLKDAGIPADILIGRQGLEEIASRLKMAEMLISVNTGIMHLGAILGVPTVALNGPNSEHRWGPVGPRVANVQTSDGSGGFLDLGFEFQGRNVMHKISIDSVVEAVQKVTVSDCRFNSLVESRDGQSYK